MAKKFFHSENFVKDLLIIDILSRTTYENPKNSKQILQEVQSRLKEIFPDYTVKIKEKKNDFNTTVLRHVHDMNQSGLFDIRTCKQKQRGYYNARGNVNGKNCLFTPEEFALIATTLYRTPSISKEETKHIMLKFENLINILDEPFNKFFKTQIQYCRETTRKTSRQTMPVLQEILYAIINGKKIQFKLYDPISLSNPNIPPKFQKIKKNFKSDEEKSVARDKIYTVSPYFPTFNDDQCYIVVHYPKNDDTDGINEYKRLTHFPISLIGDLKVLDQDATPLEEIEECTRYIINSERTFSPEKYLTEHFNMTADVTDMIDVTIQFKSDFLHDLLMQFGSSLRYYPAPRHCLKQNFANNEIYLQTVLKLPNNNGTYQWFIQNLDYLKIIGPQNFRLQLTNQLEQALARLNNSNAA